MPFRNWRLSSNRLTRTSSLGARDIQTLSETVARVSPKLDAFASGNGPINSKTDSISEDLNKIIQRLDGLEKSIVEGNSKMDTLQSGVTALMKRVADVENETAATKAGLIDEL